MTVGEGEKKEAIMSSWLNSVSFMAHCYMQLQVLSTQLTVQANY